MPAAGQPFRVVRAAVQQQAATTLHHRREAVNRLSRSTPGCCGIHPGIQPTGLEGPAAPSERTGVTAGTVAPARRANPTSIKAWVRVPRPGSGPGVSLPSPAGSAGSRPVWAAAEKPGIGSARVRRCRRAPANTPHSGGWQAAPKCTRPRPATRSTARRSRETRLRSARMRAARWRVPGPAVVPEARPGRLDLLDPGSGQRLKSGESHEEARIARGNDLAPGLLKHDFRNQYLVGVTGSAPRQIATATVKPVQQPVPKLLRLE